MTWKQLIESFLMNPEDTSIQANQSNDIYACLSILFSPEILEVGLLPTLSSHFLYNALLLQELPQAALATSDDMSLQLFYIDPSNALEAAFSVDSILGKKGIHTMMSIGYGEGMLLQNSFKSIETLRAKRLNYYSNIHEVSVTKNFVQSIELPSGVGSFNAPIKLQQAAGFPFWILKDYR